MNDINEILADVKQEGSDPFAALEKETPSESPAVEEPKVEEPVEGANTPEDNVPFHKHPRWIERENELKSLKDREEETARELAELKSFKEETTKIFETANEQSEVPSWFRELYGENEIAWGKYSQREREREDAIEQKILARQEQRQKQAQQEAQRWNEWVKGSLDKLESEGKVFDRNKLVKVMLDYRPTDVNNNFDFEAGHKIYEALESKEVDPRKSEARKQIADIASGSSKGEKKAQDFQTPETLRGKSWNQL